MRTRSSAIAIFAIAAASIWMISLNPAQARQWRATPEALAQDYSMILDTRTEHRQVLLYWASAPSIKNASATSRLDNEVESVLDKYVLIGIADAQVSAGGTFAFADISAPAVSANGASLKLLTTSELPPTVAGGFTALQAVFSRSLGQVGAGIHWFAYDAGGFRACRSGRLAVAYGGENYTYDAPIPGCPTI